MRIDVTGAGGSGSPDKDPVFYDLGPMGPSRTLSAAEISSERLLLRRALHDADREGFIELSTDPEVQAYIGGPRPRSDVEQRFDAAIADATSKPGAYVIADSTTNRFIGTLMLARRSAEAPGHVTEDGGELELGYVLRRSAWGVGFAFEAATAVLRAAADELPDQPVLLVTQTANKRSLKLAARLGFRPVSTFEEYGAEQTLCVAPLSMFKI
ncbi:RimJ/RimL family protein N-acetyltransferase [Streptosporangium becharense]|uniref:RimJ/RimL family protein N-acetyltransferase n=1 Tax=Streptosporangium becharense TaxID=1816182 RepID=A0A7W9ME34_9ACTN|nr:GNAT family N-acetyltransferase [Streptosporangium becharense]MBB2910740.1 RimJ/RimL family protein N-acetyltransferase [Streptosporangium becharense]MBB5817435.1 RimJ/RimL family protein N-acetyltransferase [Streptosporangium becharense]